MMLFLVKGIVLIATMLLGRVMEDKLYASISAIF